tara:strand:+ start:2629 stop:2958 length:330 start_codon:yes stop_codon:yes gene_type:complete
MDTIVVKFANNFHVPGFGRKRFPAGIVEDVPASMRKKLPKSAVVLEDYVPETQVQADEDERRAADFARSATDTSEETLAQAGMAGFAVEDGELVEAVEKPTQAPRRVKK